MQAQLKSKLTISYVVVDAQNDTRFETTDREAALSYYKNGYEVTEVHRTVSSSTSSHTSTANYTMLEWHEE